MIFHREPYLKDWVLGRVQVDAYLSKVVETPICLVYRHNTSFKGGVQGRGVQESSCLLLSQTLKSAKMELGLPSSKLFYFEEDFPKTH